MYLSNPIPGNDWIVRVEVYCILPTNSHNHGLMIDPPDTCWVVCNTPLPIWVKNLIPLCTMNLKSGTCLDVCNMPLPVRTKKMILIYRMNLKPDTFRGVCNTPIPILDKYLINTYLLNPIPRKDWIVCIGASYTLLTNAHDHGQMIDPPDTCGGVCNTPLHGQSNPCRG